MKPGPGRPEKATGPTLAPLLGAGQGKGDGASFELRPRIHRQLIDRIDLSKLDSLPAELVQQQIRRILEDLLAGDETPLSRQEREQLVLDVQHAALGRG